MKVLANIPSSEDFAKAYDHLQHERRSVSCEYLVLYSQWGRFDPRFAEILVTFIFQYWKDFSPLEVNQHLLKSAWPQAFGVYVEHVQLLLKVNGESKQEREFFIAWTLLCMKGVAPASTQLFFIGLEKLAGHRVQAACERSTRPYTKWGYLSQEVLFNKHRKFECTQVSKYRRQRVIESLIATERPFTVDDYRRALNWGISRRTAQRDLAEDPRLGSSGHTRNKRHFRLR